jgi:hypothetical protein
MKDSDEKALPIRMSLEDGSTATSSLVAIGYGQVHLQSQRWIEPGQRVSLQFRRISLQGIALYSKPRKTGFLSCLELDCGSDQERKEPRFPLNLPAEIAVLGEEGIVAVQGFIKDISPSGLGLRMPLPVEVSCTLCVETETLLIVGDVRRCAMTQDGHYVVGVRLTDILPDAALNLVDKRRRQRIPGYASVKSFLSTLRS